MFFFFWAKTFCDKREGLSHPKQARKVNMLSELRIQVAPLEDIRTIKYGDYFFYSKAILSIVII